MRLASGLICLIPLLPLAAQGPGQLSLESLFHPTRKLSFVEAPTGRYSWLPDGSLLEEQQQKGQLTGLLRRDPATWAATPLLDKAQFTAALGAAGATLEAAAAAFKGPFTWNPAMDAFLAKAGPDTYLVSPAKATARRILANGELESASFSPDGARIAFLKGNDIQLLELASLKLSPLTTGGDDNHYHGRLDWVYQEEVFGRGDFRAFWWSPDSRSLAFLSLDETKVPSYTLTDDRVQPQKVITYRYPQAGEANPVARLGVVDLAGKVQWLADPYPGQETLIVNVGWDPQGRVVANFQDRIQSWLECRRFEGGRGERLVREDSKAWVERLALPRFLKDGGFLWKSSSSGRSHLYRYDAQGRNKGAVTAGDWDVHTVHGIDEQAGKVYFDGSQRSSRDLDGFRTDLQGPANAHLQRLTEAAGTHMLTFNATFTGAMDRWSDLETPQKQLFLNAEGKVLHTNESKISTAFQEIRRGKVSFQQVPTRDGFPMETLLVLPPDFDPAKKYPVFQYVYGGPGAPMVRNAFGRDNTWYQFLAQQGIVTWICDNRSASGKGPASMHGVHRRLGAQELEDQLDGLKWLAAQGWADPNRIALYGYSYGGYFTSYAMTHSKAWKLGIIGAPVVDWRYYDSIYTERYMGLPKDNPEGYDASSALKAAAQLSGKVMFIHGTLDDNVHPQNTVAFLDALQKAGLDAPVTLMPGSGHSPRAPQHTWAMYESIWGFLKANL